MPTISSAAASTSATRTLEDLQKSQRTANQTLDKDAFLQLLVEQMANQDPLSPTSDTDFIAQLAQFSSLEQLQTISDSTLQTQAYNLVGKYVYLNGIDSATGNPIFGKVDGVFRMNGIDYIVIGDSHYALSDVAGVVNVDEPASSTTTVTNSTGLLGKNVTAKITDDNGETVSVSGTVTKVYSKDNVVYALVGEHEVPVSSITEIYS